MSVGLYDGAGVVDVDGTVVHAACDEAHGKSWIGGEGGCAGSPADGGEAAGGFDAAYDGGFGFGTSAGCGCGCGCDSEVEEFEFAAAVVESNGSRVLSCGRNECG